MVRWKNRKQYYKLSHGFQRAIIMFRCSVMQVFMLSLLVIIMIFVFKNPPYLFPQFLCDFSSVVPTLSSPHLDSSFLKAGRNVPYKCAWRLENTVIRLLYPYLKNNYTAITHLTNVHHHNSPASSSLHTTFIYLC